MAIDQLSVRQQPLPLKKQLTVQNVMTLAWYLYISLKAREEQYLCSHYRVAGCMCESL